MMWMMVICCALPIAIIFFGGTALFSGEYFGIILVGILALICISMMVRGHRHRAIEEASGNNVATANDNEKGHTNHSGCH